MGATSSIISRQFNHEYYEETYEECKDERDFDSSRISCNNTDSSSVWLAIDAILKSIHTIKKDFKILKNNEILFEMMKKIIINIDSIYNIQQDSFEHGKIQPVYEEDIVIVKKTLQEYYGDIKLVVIKLKNNQSVYDLGLFMYDIFNIQVVEIEEKNKYTTSFSVNKYLYVYVV